MIESLHVHLVVEVSFMGDTLPIAGRFEWILKTVVSVQWVY